MSTEDKQKWESRYREGAYSERTHPSVYLEHAVTLIGHPLPGYKALDLACGAGRNALYLAAQGFQVDAVDIANEALRRGCEAAAAASLQQIYWREHDLDEDPDPSLQRYGLIIMMRYLDIARLRTMVERLVPGGYLLSEVHLQTDQAVTGPSSNQFRAAPGELKTVAEGLDVVEYTEEVLTDPDGNTVAVARLLARKSGPVPVLIESETKRLVIRQWRLSDYQYFAQLNADPAVMEYFPKILSADESDALATRCEMLIAQRGWGFWALEEKASGHFIGFTGLHTPSSALPFSPCVEIGWRLAKTYWGRGYATEAAREALRIGFKVLEPDEIVSFTTHNNFRSQAVMRRLGMSASGSFDHPALPESSALRKHVVYRLARTSKNQSDRP